MIILGWVIELSVGHSVPAMAKIKIGNDGMSGMTRAPIHPMSLDHGTYVTPEIARQCILGISWHSKGEVS